MTTPIFPAYAKILFEGYSEQREPGLLRTEMESGPPRQAKVRSRVMKTRSVKIYLETTANYKAFENWYANDLSEGALWFGFTDTVSKDQLLARFVGGGYQSQPLAPGLKGWAISAKIESWG